MDANRIDDLAKRLGQGADRRKVLGGLALGSLGALGLTRVASAQATTDDELSADDNRKKKCKKRCQNHCNDNKSNKKCRKKCQDKCDRKNN